nr:FecR domain-containing protein [uncultured Carboxylicivirga sp.]
MHEFKNKDILTKYTDEETSSGENIIVEDWLAENGEEKEIKSFFKNEWYKYIQKSNDADKKDLTHILHKVHHSIRTTEAKQKKNLSQLFIKWYTKAAAILFIPLIIGALSYPIFQNLSLPKSTDDDSIIKVVCPEGNKMAFSLPDGTKGMLNSGSSIEYQIPFNKKRNVTISGEVYLDVFHNKRRPFKVHYGESFITVLGTKFNIKAYPEENTTEIVLAEGKITWQANESSKPVTINPNEKLLIKKDKLSICNVDASTYASWKDGMLVFRGESMEDAINKLQRWYNVEIEIIDEEIWTYSFTGTFLNDSLEEVLKLLKKTSPLDFKLLPREINKDGSWKQRKVQLFKRNT